MRKIAAAMLWSAAALVMLGVRSACAADKGFYFTAGTGIAEEDPGRSIGLNIAFGPPPNSVVHHQPDSVAVDGNDLGWGVGIGYKFSRHLSAEVEYVDYATTNYSEQYTVDFPPLPPTLSKDYTSHVSGPSASVLGTFPVGRGFEIYVRAGALFADRKVDIPGLLYVDANLDTTFSDTVWLAGIGVDWSCAELWGIRFEYQQSGEMEANLLAGGAAVQAFLLRARFSL
jgi:hypothetical protein